MYSIKSAFISATVSSHCVIIHTKDYSLLFYEYCSSKFRCLLLYISTLLIYSALFTVFRRHTKRHVYFIGEIDCTVLRYNRINNNRQQQMYSTIMYQRSLRVTLTACSLLI